MTDARATNHEPRATHLPRVYMNDEPVGDFVDFQQGAFNTEGHACYWFRFHPFDSERWVKMARDSKEFQVRACWGVRQDSPPNAEPMAYQGRWRPISFGSSRGIGWVEIEVQTP